MEDFDGILHINIQKVWFSFLARSLRTAISHISLTHVKYFIRNRWLLLFEAGLASWNIATVVCIPSGTQAKSNITFSLLGEVFKWCCVFALHESQNLEVFSLKSFSCIGFPLGTYILKHVLFNTTSGNKLFKQTDIALSHKIDDTIYLYGTH